MSESKIYDFADVALGVVGAAKLWTRTWYTNARSILGIERCHGPGQLNSGKDKNSQTLHFGDIEANYLIESALHVKAAGTMVANYASRHNVDVFQRLNKMLLAVGHDEIAELRNRFEIFSHRGYPGIKLLGREAIAELEQKVVEGRNSNQPIAAIQSSDGHAISFEDLSRSFIRNAQRSSKDIYISYNTTVLGIQRVDGIYYIETNRGTFKARNLNVAAGAHSLLFAHRLGYGKEFTLFPIAGSFWLSDRVLNGKVYTMNDPDIPFAAPHGDPPFHNPNETRWGPTAKLIPFLIRHSPGTFFDFVRILPRTLDGWKGLLDVTLFNPRLSVFMAKNILYDAPILGKALYLQQIQKIVPTMRYSDLRFGKGIGGLRPQMFNTAERKIIFGLHLIVGHNSIFNIAPSPGGTACIQNAKENIMREQKFLGNEWYKFDEKKFADELETDTYSGAAH